MTVDRDAPHDGETVHEQLTRNWNELLQELRVTQTGVQILTGFLLTVPFTDRFPDLTTTQRNIYLAVLAGSVLTTCSIVAPVAFHRVLFRQRQRPWLVKASHVAARVGLTSLALVCAGVILLVFDIVVNGWAGIAAAAGVLVVFFFVWLVLPLIGVDRDAPGPT